jgi:hypothetical protein
MDAGDGETGFHEASDMVEGVDGNAGENVGQRGGLVQVEL